MASYPTFPSFEPTLLLKKQLWQIVRYSPFFFLLPKFIKFSRFSLEVQYGHLTVLTNKSMEVMVASSGPMPIKPSIFALVCHFLFLQCICQKANFSGVSNIVHVSISRDAQCYLETQYPISLLPTCSIFGERERCSIHLNHFISRGYFNRHCHIVNNIFNTIVSEMTLRD